MTRRARRIPVASAGGRPGTGVDEAGVAAGRTSSSARSRLAGALGSRLPRRTVRFRLTVLYGVLFLASGAALLAATAALWGNSSPQETKLSTPAWLTIVRSLVPPRQIPRSLLGVPPRLAISVQAHGPVPASSAFITGASVRQQRIVAFQLHAVVTRQRTSDLHELLLISALALALMALLAVVLGWLTAGRALRPMRTITSAARRISATNLHERLHLRGPDDELKELGDTFDDLLARLDGAFQSQRRFVANASHELRTPLATIRTALDVAVAKPGIVPRETVELAARVRAELDQVDRLLDGFLALARAEHGPLDERSLLRLDAIVAEAVVRHDAQVAELGLSIDVTACDPVALEGSGALVTSMVENLIDNAVKHNEVGGWIRIAADATGGVARLVVENGGACIDPERIIGLSEPFRRLGIDRTGSECGSGLGLSIVQSVAQAHHGTLSLQAIASGGFRVVVELPTAVGVLARTTR